MRLPHLDIEARELVERRWPVWALRVAGLLSVAVPNFVALLLPYFPGLPVAVGIVLGIVLLQVAAVLDRRRPVLAPVPRLGWHFAPVRAVVAMRAPLSESATVTLARITAPVAVVEHAAPAATRYAERVPGERTTVRLIPRQVVSGLRRNAGRW